MTPNPQVQAVQAIYSAFGAGDIPAILERLSADVRWESWADNFGQRGGAPTLVERRGPDAVMAFFQVVGTLQIHGLQVLDILPGERQVAAEITIDFTVPSTGFRYRDEEMHLWTFDAHGRVSRFRHYLDTAKHLRAFGLPMPA